MRIKILKECEAYNCGFCGVPLKPNEKVAVLVIDRQAVVFCEKCKVDIKKIFNKVSAVWRETIH